MAKESMMSHLRLLICRVDDATEQMTALDHLDLPALPPDAGTAPLDTLEARVALVGPRVLGRRCELLWEEIDAQAVARYRTAQAPGSVIADGYETLLVASRFGTLGLRRQVCTHRDGRPHVMPGNDLLPDHHGLLITRGLQEVACLLAQDLPFATAARLLGWQTGEPGVLGATTVRKLVRQHGGRIRRLEQGEAQYVLSTGTRGQRLRGVPVDRPRRRPGWPPALSAAVEAAVSAGQERPPEGVSRADWERVLAARAEEGEVEADNLRRLGPALAPGQMLLVLDEVLAPAPGPGHSHEVRTACLLTADGRRYLSGRGSAFLRQVRAAVQACCDRSLLVVADGASWIRAFFQDHLTTYPQAEMVLDWYHLAKKCRDLGARLCPERRRRGHLLCRLLRALWAGNIPRALRVLAMQDRQGADPTAVEDLIAYLRARAAWIPDDRARRRQRRFIGNGLGEKANDRIVARRQKRRGMQWGVQSSDALAALRTLRLNAGWERYWQGRHLLHLSVAA